MTNPMDDEESVSSLASVDDDAISVEIEEDIPSDDEIKRGVKKKTVALKARLALEDYLEEKKIRKQLDYIYDVPVKKT